MSKTEFPPSREIKQNILLTQLKIFLKILQKNVATNARLS